MGDADVDPADDTACVASDEDDVIRMALEKLDSLFQNGWGGRIPQFAGKTGCRWPVIRRDFADRDQYIQDSVGRIALESGYCTPPRTPRCTFLG